MKKNLFLFVILISACDLINPPDDNGEDSLIYSSTLSGKVLLENQIEHSNALIYIDSLDIGVSSDSSSLFKFQFTDDDSIYNGIFTIYYFLEDYEIDSARIMLTSGKVKLDTLDVDSKGNLPLVEMKQILHVEGWTNKEEYRIGEMLDFTARWTNVSDRIISLFIPSSGHVGIYRDANYPGFSLTPGDPVPAYEIYYLSPGSFYEEDSENRVPEGTYTYRWVNSTLVDTFWVLEPVEYIVINYIEIEDRGYTVPKTMRDFIFFEWEGLHLGESPRYDKKPNKFDFPSIQIIE
ncbi:MAG: hypothetical protein ABIJ12_02055 [bacterium]